MKNYYRLLKLQRDSTQRDIKDAYHAAAMHSHPDKGGQSARFQEIKEAYDVLSDPKRRDEYEAEYMDEAERLGYVVCADCFSKNRVARFGSNKEVRCGHCRGVLDIEPAERDSRVRSAIADQTSELIEVLGAEGSALAKDAIRTAAEWTRKKLGIRRG